MKIDEIKIYCLTLKSTPERERLAREQFERLKLNVEFFYGIDGRNLNLDTMTVFETTKRGMEHWKIRNGVVGCGLSHSLLWNVALRKKFQEFIVFEDDVTLPDDFRERFDASYYELPYDWGIFYLGGGERHESYVKTKVSEHLCRYAPTGTYAYMMRHEKISLFIAAASQNLIDLDIRMQEVSSLIPFYIADPVIATEKSVGDGKMPASGIWKSLTYDWK